jgi:hypothetical protein
MFQPVIDIFLRRHACGLVGGGLKRSGLICCFQVELCKSDRDRSPQRPQNCGVLQSLEITESRGVTLGVSAKIDLKAALVISTRWTNFSMVVGPII